MRQNDERKPGDWRIPDNMHSINAMQATLMRSEQTGIRGRTSHICTVLAISVCIGCQSILPINRFIELPIGETMPLVIAGGRFVEDAAFDDAVWLEIDRTGTEGTIGGFLSTNENSRAALILMLSGASTLTFGGPRGVAIKNHAQYSGEYRDAGFLTWVLMLPECGVPYGGQGVDDVVEVIDWLEGGGKDVLGVERIYVLGYSTGGTIANLVNLRRSVTASVSVSGLTQPDQFREDRRLFEFVAGLFPNNEGMCQLQATLDAYGAADSPGWDALDVVSRVDELQNPMLVIHGTEDFVYSLDNARNLEAAYIERAASVDDLVPLEFLYVEGSGHFLQDENLELRPIIVEYFERFEPSAE